MHLNDGESLTNSVDPDQAAPFCSSLMGVFTVCLDLSVRKFRNIIVYFTGSVSNQSVNQSFEPV